MSFVLLEEKGQLYLAMIDSLLCYYVQQGLVQLKGQTTTNTQMHVTVIFDNYQSHQDTSF